MTELRPRYLFLGSAVTCLALALYIGGFTLTSEQLATGAAGLFLGCYFGVVWAGR